MRLRNQSRPLVVHFATVFALLVGWCGIAMAGTVEYDLVVDYKTVNFTGKDVRAMTINGQLPGPTLEMTEGDDLVVRVHNRMDVETSIHWHGLLLPNKEDGVPYLTTPPIRPGQTYTYSFPIKQSGTYWYHSHTGLQEQRGVLGSIVIHHKEKRVHADAEHVVMLSDWTDEDPKEVMRTLKRGSEYYMLKKGAMPNLIGAIQTGALKETLQQSLDRMPPMDISDVAYDRFLANGKPETAIEAAPGQTVLLRIINGSSATYFYLQFAGGPIRVVAADGLDVEPFETDRMLVAIAETYDVLVTIPQGGGAFEFRATAQDGSGHASAYLGTGKRVAAPDIPKPDLYRAHSAMGMDHGGHADMNMPKQDTGHGEHHAMDHGRGHAMQPPARQPDPPRPGNPYERLRSPQPTTLPPDRPWQTINLNLTGDMERYIWSFNGKTLSEADYIVVRKGQNVRIVFENKTMMNHPIHLHGHFFRVLNGQGDHAPLKHTVDIPPFGKRVIEFYGSEDKDWFMHCHVLYHMMSGMTRIVHYEGSQPDPVIAAIRHEPGNEMHHDPFYFWGQAAFLSQMSDGEIVLSNTRNIFSVKWEGAWEDQGDDDQFEVEATYNRYFDRFLTLFGGVDVTEEHTRGVFGVRYLLPFNIESSLWVDTEGEFRAAVHKDIQITDRLSAFAEAQYDTEERWEWLAGLEWTLTKELSIVGQYHSDFGAGAGVSIRF